MYYQDGTAKEEGLYIHEGATGFTPASLKRQNWIMNGDFNIWQRGTSVSSTTYRVGPDRFGGTSNFGGTISFVRTAFTVGQTDVPDNPTYFCRFNRGSNAWNIVHWIENVTLTANKTFVVSLWGKVTGGSVGFGFDAEQYFGSGGSSSVSATVTNIGPSYTWTTSWQRFLFRVSFPSVSGKTLGAGHCVRIYLMTNTGTGALGIDFAHMSMTEGPTVRDFSPMYPSLAQETIACERYFQKSYEPDTAPGAGDNKGRKSWVCNGFTSGTYTIENDVEFRTTMRANPTIATYGTSSSTPGNVNVSSGEVACTATNNNPRGFHVSAVNGTSVTERRLQFHWISDAELA